MPTWTADFWFDPSCPYTWITSRWAVEVARVRPVRLRWHVLSLSVLNEGREEDPENDPEGYLWIPVRVCAAVHDHYGQEALGRFYTALWTVGREPHDDWMGPLEDALAAAGLPRELAAAGHDPDLDASVRASHESGVALVGDHVGTPIIAVTGPGGEQAAFFGPVLSQAPAGEDAGRLWDAVLAVASVPGFHELKATPPAPPRIDSAAPRG
ncbi:disulfide bond formation protein DsbA [Nocardiopsis mangrovi]|uniref:Disulfide bond formation protein DsbA n=1 Tax=Nocardiopsis mangrovi TaxID=1179818 RepID=A0ABV9DV38_9ACTN